EPAQRLARALGGGEIGELARHALRLVVRAVGNGRDDEVGSASAERLGDLVLALVGDARVVADAVAAGEQERVGDGGLRRARAAGDDSAALQVRGGTELVARLLRDRSEEHTSELQSPD